MDTALQIDRQLETIEKDRGRCWAVYAGSWSQYLWFCSVMKVDWQPRPDNLGDSSLYIDRLDRVKARDPEKFRLVIFGELPHRKTTDEAYDIILGFLQRGGEVWFVLDVNQLTRGQAVKVYLGADPSVAELPMPENNSLQTSP